MCRLLPRLPQRPHSRGRKEITTAVSPTAPNQMTLSLAEMSNNQRKEEGCFFLLEEVSCIHECAPREEREEQREGEREVDELLDLLTMVISVKTDVSSLCFSLPSSFSSSPFSLLPSPSSLFPPPSSLSSTLQV